MTYGPKPQDYCRKGHPYSPANTRFATRPEGRHRVCKTCERAAQLARRTNPDIRAVLLERRRTRHAAQAAAQGRPFVAYGARPYQATFRGIRWRMAPRGVSDAAGCGDVQVSLPVDAPADLVAA